MLAQWQRVTHLCLLDLEDFRRYLEKRFDFEQVTVKKFRTWAERRQFNREMKRKQAESERPILPANQKLITLSVQDAPTKKGNFVYLYFRQSISKTNCSSKLD